MGKTNDLMDGGIMIALAEFAISDKLAILSVPSARWTIQADNPAMILLFEESVNGSVPHYSTMKNTLGGEFSDYHKGILHRDVQSTGSDWKEFFKNVLYDKSKAQTQPVLNPKTQ